MFGKSVSTIKRWKTSGIPANTDNAKSIERAYKAAKKLQAKAATKSQRKPTVIKAGTAKKAGKAVVNSLKAPFKGGLTKQVAKGFKAVKNVFKQPKTPAQKETLLKKIGIEPIKKKKPGEKLTAYERKKINKTYAEFSEFISNGRQRFRIVKTTNQDTLNKARKTGMAVYGNSIYIHVAGPKETATIKKFMGEKIIARTYYGKTERIFLGGADTFDRVVNKLQTKKLKPTEFITGAFFGGPTFHKAIYPSVAAFLNYINNQFVPHLPEGTAATKRNIARAKADLIKNIAIVEIDDPQFAEDEWADDEDFDE